MNLNSCELLFYAGIAIIAISAIFLLLSACIFKIKSLKLSAAFDKEYGEKSKKK